MPEAAEKLESEPPLYVDLDGTLVKTDLLLESLLVLIKAQPWTILLLPVWLARGRAHLKAQIALRAEVAADTLVYDERIVERLRADRARGRQLVLATASNAKYADAVAAHLGVFDAVLASDDARNLKGARKLEAIVAHAEGGVFDYAGNEAADLPIWRKARKVICVDTPGPVVRKVRTFAEPDELARPRRSFLKLFVKAIRVHQWAKNGLLFVPIIAAHKVNVIADDIRAVAGFVAFSLCASSVYVLNDLTDLRADRLHPRKRKRPFASGDLPLTYGLALSPLLLAASATISALMLPQRFWIVLAAYYVAFMAYNFAAKERVVWDVILLAGLYVVRVVAGAAAVPVTLSFWLLAFSMFFFLSLALAKRYSEMHTLHKLGRTTAHGRGYLTDDMPVLQSMGVSSGYLAVLVMALYINSPEIHALYARPYALWAICPLMLFWISRIWVKTHRGQMHDDPVVFALRDRVSLLVGAATIAFAAVGTL
ncbi:MAG TPA: UbiA family prenyltransferase [Kofleriaceae bacterium]|nr:UbiA family prenyltransferase [Kofleriaceae bacterium]